MRKLAAFLFCVFAFACSKNETPPLAVRTVLLPPVNGIYHSCYPDFSDTEDSVNAASILNFENLAGKNTAWIYFSDNWWNGIHFPESSCNLIHSLGRIPFIRMMARSNQTGAGAEPVYTLQNIIDGRFDAELLNWFRAAKNFGSPLLCEFGTEVNGDWFPWNGRWNGGGESNAYAQHCWMTAPNVFAMHSVTSFFFHEEQKPTTSPGSIM